jgi:hypothetical protein
MPRLDPTKDHILIALAPVMAKDVVERALRYIEAYSPHTTLVS